MDDIKKRPLRKFFSWINNLRLFILNLLFLGIIVLVLIEVIPSGKVRIKNDSLLLVNPQGQLVLRSSVSPMEQQIKSLQGLPPAESSVYPLIESIKRAKSDPKITAIHLDLSSISPSGLTMTKYLYDTLWDFKESGKQIIAFSDYIDQERLLLLSLADHLYVDPLVNMGKIGFNSHRIYWGESFNNLGIEAHIYRAGQYKSYTEVFSQGRQSPESQEELSRWMDELWNQYTQWVSQGLSIDQDEFIQWTQNHAERLVQASGNWAGLLDSQQWISGIVSYDDFIKIKEKLFSMEEVGYLDYIQNDQNRRATHVNLAVLPLSGEIIYGEGDWGYMGSQSVIRVLEKIEMTPGIDGLILWMDSPGGSAWASEKIRRKLMELKAQGLPIALVMGNSCASGGYWIATAADYIVAESSTITGSIGVFSYLFTAQGLLSNTLYAQEGGYSTVPGTWSPRLSSAPTEEFNLVQQSQVEWIYNNFLDLVSQSRGILKDSLNNLAEGRIWTGTEALENGLVDKIGSLEQAKGWFAQDRGKSADQVDLTFFEEQYQYSRSPLANWFTQAVFRNSDIANLFSNMEEVESLIPRDYNDPRGVIGRVEWQLDM
ncbi:MAG: signal peptide peptidase SppA [Spirochaetaceae bacterium]|jgi:protease-4|nr:signal peptide peptidase SppA [Spirochaetaceae bacterium]